MTREFLHDEITNLLSGVSVPPLSRSLAGDIVDLFDRYEAEKWKPCSEPPIGGRDVIVWEMSPNYPRTMYYYNQEWHDTGIPTELGQSAVWRELPTPPRKGEPMR